MTDYCKAETDFEDNLEIEMIEGKAWHDDDLYTYRCKKCGETGKQLARRPSGIIVKCGVVWE